SIFYCFFSQKADGKIGIAGIKIEPRVNVTYSYDDNYRFTEKKESAYTINVSPSLDFSYEKGIAEIRLNLRSPYRYFSESTGKKSKFQDTFYEAEMTVRLPARIKLHLEDNFVSTELSPFLTKEKFDRTDRSENRFAGDIFMPIGTMFDVFFNYRNENYRYIDKSNTFFSFSKNNRKLDNMNIRLGFKPVKDTSFFVRYWYQRNLYKNDPLRDSQSRQVNYGIQQSIGDFIRINAQIGTGKRKANSVSRPEDDRLTWSTGVFLALTDRLSLYYNVNRTVTDTSYKNVKKENTRRTLSMFLSLRGKLTDHSDIDIIAGRTRNWTNSVNGGNSVFKNITVRLDNQFFERIRNEIEYRFGLNEFEGGGFFFGSVKRKDRRWNIEDNLNFRISRKTNLRFGYLHEKRTSFFGSFVRNRYTFSINFTY
ncbi:MAG: hypothetical protein D6734_11165, partial [Candidatus Schekmanbacteria bacterium]